MNDNAGNGSSIAYVSFETMHKNLGEFAVINHYEIVMPNPVSKFALGIVKEKIGVAESEIEIVENTTRYQLLPLLEVLRNFGMRSMNGKAIIYPYWENIAKGYEDILALLLVFRFLFLLYPVILLVILLVVLVKHRTWHFRDVKAWAERKWEVIRIKGITKKQKKKAEPPEELDEEEPWL